MNIKLLGTGAGEGMPALFCHCDICRRAAAAGGKNFRARSNALVNDTILIDFSPDMHHNQLRYGLDLGNVTDLFITHPHVDHIAACELLLRSEVHYCFGLDGRRIRVHCSPESKSLIQGLVHYDQGSKGEDFLDFQPLQPFVPIQTDSITVTPLPVRHAKEGFPCYIFLLEQEGRQFLYGNDAAEFLPPTWDFLLRQQLSGAVLDCTYGLTPITKRSSHMNLQRDAETWQRLREGGALREDAQCWLTHFSHKCGALHEELEQAAAPYGLSIAYDGLELHI